MCSCNKSKQVVPNQNPSLATPLMTAFVSDDGEVKEVVEFISSNAGFYTTDSGNRYKSYGRGSRVTIMSSDRKSLEQMWLIATK